MILSVHKKCDFNFPQSPTNMKWLMYAPNTDSMHDHVREQFPSAKYKYEKNKYVWRIKGKIVAEATPHSWREGWVIEFYKEIQ